VPAVACSAIGEADRLIRLAYEKCPLLRRAHV
jgi:hypothetical protein